ncbi:hypothetical protein ABIB40_002793 [Pedobacter sp. UYP30]|uniref:outer membrane beta-barrel protein n=1 Tax=Pedobacter sp. UYP30 TaxID=1756400 RepID=UPI003395025D
MKTITKIMSTAAFAVAVFFTSNANAQSRNFGIGLNAGIPTETGGQFAIGGDLRYQFNIDEQLSIPITVGYTNLSYKYGNVKVNSGYIPVKVGAKYFFDKSGSGVYGLAELGAAFGTDSPSKTSFVYSPAIGYSWDNGLDLAAKYEGLARDGRTGGYVGLRLAYGFRL